MQQYLSSLEACADNKGLATQRWSEGTTLPSLRRGGPNSLRESTLIAVATSEEATSINHSVLACKLDKASYEIFDNNQGPLTHARASKTPQPRNAPQTILAALLLA